MRGGQVTRRTAAVLAVLAAGAACVVAGVYLIAGLGVALVVAGVPLVAGGVLVDLDSPGRKRP